MSRSSNDDVELWLEPECRGVTAYEVHGGKLQQRIGFLAVHLELPKRAIKSGVRKPIKSGVRRPRNKVR
jgi:hypothetical protein